MSGLKIALAAAVLLAGFGTSRAEAQNTTHGCACIHNNTKATISYRYKWGEQAWQNFKLQPAYQNWICWKYADSAKSSPALTFQLDVDMTKGSAWTTFNLPRMQATASTCEATPKGAHYDNSYRPEHQQPVHPGHAPLMAGTARYCSVIASV
ncbi:MAG: hypothetical protein PSV46_09365 [Reyranella sp.]|nr:hypothetical protein [Reyranella sp.]